MWRSVAVVLSLSACAEPGRVRADDVADELARLAGEYTAESRTRTGQLPAPRDVLKGLSLVVSKDGWTQTFRGDVAPYAIALDLTRKPSAMRLTHLKVQAVRDCTYVLDKGVLTVTERVGDNGDVVVTVWKRKLNPA